MSPTLVLKFVRIFLAVAGLVVLGVSLWLYQSTSRFIADASRAPGVVIDIERSRSSDNSSTYYPVVRFTSADGVERTFVPSWGSSSPRYQRGQAVQILYTPARPEEAEIEDFVSLWLLPLVLGLVGGVFLLFGGGMIAFDMVFRRRKRILQTSGQLILADFTSVERNGSLEVNGQLPWRIMCQWQNPVTGKLHVFASDNIWFDPTGYVTQKQINVRIDPKNPKRHWMDTSFLPEMA